LSGSGSAVAINKVCIDLSSITILRMSTNEKGPIRGQDSLLKDAEDKFLLFPEKRYFIGSLGNVG
jgi:hypothetical protein